MVIISLVAYAYERVSTCAHTHTHIRMHTCLCTAVQACRYVINEFYSHFLARHRRHVECLARMRTASEIPKLFYAKLLLHTNVWACMYMCAGWKCCWRLWATVLDATYNLQTLNNPAWLHTITNACVDFLHFFTDSWVSCNCCCWVSVVDFIFVFVIVAAHAPHVVLGRWMTLVYCRFCCCCYCCYCCFCCLRWLPTV